MIRAALRTAGKERVSIDEGKQIVDAFRSLIPSMTARYAGGH